MKTTRYAVCTEGSQYGSYYAVWSYVACTLKSGKVVYRKGTRITESYRSLDKAIRLAKTALGEFEQISKHSLHNIPVY